MNVTPEIETEVQSVLDTVSAAQKRTHMSGQQCFKQMDQATTVRGLIYSVVNYESSKKGCGYGVRFEFNDGETVYEKSVDVGFLMCKSCAGHFDQYDWRKKSLSPLAV